MRSRIVTISSATVVAGVILFGSATAAHAAPSSPDAATDAGTSALSPLLELLLESEAAPGSADAAEALSVAPAGPGSLQTDGESRVSVTVTFATQPDAGTLDSLRALGAEIVAVSPFLPKVTAFVPVGSLEPLAARGDVVGVAADLAARHGSVGAAGSAAGPVPASTDAGCRSIPVSVDPGLKSDLARARFGVDGSGVTVGVISDSFQAVPDPASTAANDVLLGVLPGPGNPCGYTEPVETMTPVPVTSKNTDEGRAMAQMVHGVAPGARLLFGAGLQSPTAFSAAIVALTDAGADVIVDDILFGGSEPMYQKGEIAVAVDYATSRGVLVISAAQNQSQYGFPGTAQEDHAIGAFRSTVYTPMPCPSFVANEYAPTPVDCHNFGTATDPDASNYVAAENNGLGVFNIVLNWAEPVNGVTGSFSPAVFTRGDNSFVARGGRNDNSLPISDFSIGLPAPGFFDIYVVRELGTAGAVVEPGFTFAFLQDEAGTVQELEHYTNSDTVTVGPNIFGHTTYPEVLSVGAAPWQQPTVNEAFSSLGPVTYLFGPVEDDNSASEPLPAPDVRNKPDLTSLDRGQTSFFSPPALADGTFEFAGTSAASPAAAGVAALALQYSPLTTAPELKAVMMATTSPMISEYLNIDPRNVHGTGLLDAEATLAALPDAPLPEPTGSGSPVLAASGAPGSDVLAAAFVAVIAMIAGAVLTRRVRSVRRSSWRP